MSTFRREFTDSALTGTIDHWLDEGPTSAPDRTVEAALLTVATTRQRQLRGRLLRMADFHGPVVPVSLTVAGITAIVLVAVGLGLQNSGQPTVDGTPTPDVSSEGPEPSDLPFGYVMYRNEADGYELAVHESWDVLIEPAYGEPRTGVTRFGAGDPADSGAAALVVSVGSPEGDAYLCRGASCARVVARTLDEIEDAIKAAWSPVAPDRIGEEIVATTLGGEPARFRYPTTLGITSLGFPSSLACSAYAMHEARPIILTFTCNQFRRGLPSDLSALQAIIDSFRFLDDSPDGAFPRLGFELAMEEGWAARMSDTDLNVVLGRTDFGTFMIEVGDGDGLVQACISPDVKWPRLACSWGAGENLDELADHYFDRMGPGKDLALDGEPARRFDVRSYEYPARGGQHVTYIVAIHDGRPVILRFHTSLDSQPEGRLADALGGFRWTD